MLQTDLDAAIAKAAALQEDLDEANADLETAEDDLMTANDMVTSVRGMLDQANLDLEQARTDLQMAMDNSDDEMEIAQLKQAVTDAEGERNSYKTMLDAANLELAEAKAARDLLEAEKTAKADSDKAAEVLIALGVETPADAPTVTDLAASSDSAVTANSVGYTMSENAPDEITGYRGVILETDTAELHVYTNIADAVATSIETLYRSETLRGMPAIYSVTEQGTDDSILWSQAKRSDTVTTTSGTGTEADPETTSFAGSVLGLAGKFSCTGSDCMAPAGDVITESNAMGWKFVPTDPNGMIDVADTTYLSFGWWLNEMAGGKYETNVFANASMGMGVAVTDRQAETVAGSATYRGGAAGKWAIASTTDDTTAGGHFTATATLTANFDANTDDTGQDPNDDGVSIGGKITNFMTGAVSRPNWSVTLMAPDAVTSVGPIDDAVTEWDTGVSTPE